MQFYLRPFLTVCVVGAIAQTGLAVLVGVAAGVWGLRSSAAGMGMGWVLFQFLLGGTGHLFTAAIGAAYVALSPREPMPRLFDSAAFGGLAAGLAAFLSTGVSLAFMVLILPSVLATTAAQGTVSPGKAQQLTLEYLARPEVILTAAAGLVTSAAVSTVVGAIGALLLAAARRSTAVSRTS